MNFGFGIVSDFLQYINPCSWSLFCKEDLPGRDFTFWEWFLKILVLTQCHLASLWKEGLVKGCISKESAESMLKGKPAGTFLLRFSDSLLGGVRIAYAGQPGCKYDNTSWVVKGVFSKPSGTLNSLISKQQILFFLRKFSYLRALLETYTFMYFQGKFLPTQLLEYLCLFILAEIPSYKIILSSFKLLFCCFKHFKEVSKS